MRVRDHFIAVAAALVMALSCGGQGAVRTEHGMKDTVPDSKKKVVSVMKFEDRSIGTRDYEPWTMGIPDMIMQSLGSIPNYRVISREYIVKQVLKEQDFQLLGVTDFNNAIKLGKVLNAQYIVIGSYQVFKGILTVNAKVIQVDSGEIIYQAFSRGNLDNFNEVQNQVALRIAEGMDVNLPDEAKRKLMKKYDTRDMNASLANYKGEEKLEVITVLKKQNKVEEAKRKSAEAKKDFQEALKHDSGYTKAKKNLMKAMQGMPMTL